MTWLRWIWTLVAIAWPGTAAAVMPASPEEIMCNPAAFVVATVAGDTPEVRVPEDCRGPGAHCLIAWPMKIKIDEILATRPSDPALTDDTALRVGSIFMVNVDVFPSAAATEIAADNYQGRLSAPTLAGAELTRSIRGRRFIFGLGTNYAGRSPPRIVSDNSSQIWSTSYQGVLETTLLHAARRATAEAPDRCAALDEQKALEVAVADHPDQSAPLLLLANLHERISRYGSKEEKDRELTKGERAVPASDRFRLQRGGAGGFHPEPRQ